MKTWQDVGYDKNGDGVIDEEDLKQIFVQDVIECVLHPHYWDRWQADKIRNQSIANLLVDWLWASGITARNTVWKMTENVQTQKNKLSSPPISLYAIIVLISLLFVAAWIVRKKIIHFFLRL